MGGREEAWKVYRCRWKGQDGVKPTSGTHTHTRLLITLPKGK